MNKLQALFASKKNVLIAYVPTGDPDFSKIILDAYVDGGADILELGLPSADPYMDGAIMGGSMRRAKEAGTDGDLIARVVKEWLPKVEKPPVLLWMCYNDADFTNLEQWAAMGVIDSVLMLGTPPDNFYERLEKNNIALSVSIPWVYSEADEIRASQATGYIMVPTRPGSTGLSSEKGDPTALIARMKALNPTTPVVGGFGIDDPESARRIINCGADGVVVGTICIQTLATDGNKGLQELLKSISTELALVSNQ